MFYKLRITIFRIGVVRSKWNRCLLLLLFALSNIWVRYFNDITAFNWGHLIKYVVHRVLELYLVKILQLILSRFNCYFIAISVITFTLFWLHQDISTSVISIEPSWVFNFVFVFFVSFISFRWRSFKRSCTGRRGLWGFNSFTWFLVHLFLWFCTL